jgi:hypothetical protein
MKYFIIPTILFFTCSFFSFRTQAQNVAINTTGSAAHASSMLDVNATDRGLLIPRVALTATNAAGPITSPATSLLVYNTATAGTAPNNVTPGHYYWDGSRWVRVLNSNDNDWTRENTVSFPAIKTDNQYVTGNVGIGDFSATTITHRLHVIETGNSGSIHGIYVNESNQGQAIVIDESGEGAGLFINANSDGSAIYSTVNGAVTNNAVGFFLYDNRTSSTPSITKIGADIQSIGAWSGSGSSNTGINLVASGGTTNVGINVAVSGGTTNYAGLFTGGNVGIGTLLPHTMIHVHDPSSAINFEIARFTNGTTGSGTGDGTAFGFSNNGQNFYMDNKEGAGFQWWTSGTERMRLTGAGILTFNNNNTTAYPPYLTNGGGAFS